FTATAQNGGTVTVNATATAPAKGNVVTLVNRARVKGLPELPVSGSLARLSDNLGQMAIASDGTVYFVDTGNSLVLALTPEGVLTHVAGGGSAAAPGYGDYGPAKSARLLTPYGLALDEAN